MNQTLRRALGDILRSFRREPGFVATVLITVAVAVGANAAVFGIVSQLLFAPPPGVANAERLFHVGLRHFTADGESFLQQTMSYPAYRALRTETRAIGTLATTASDTLAIGRAPETARARVLGVSTDYFNNLGAVPAVGTFFRIADDAPNRVAVLGHGYWRQHFAGNRGVIGTTILIEENPFTIVGVAARGFNGDQTGAVDVYLPLAEFMVNRGGDWRSNTGMHIVQATARLRDGVPATIAAQLLSGAIRGTGLAAGEPRSAQVELTSVVPGADARESQQGRIALWLTAISTIVLLIASANVGTLMSIRAARRAREYSVRVALGANFATLGRAVLVESVVLAFLGATLGVVFSVWMSALIRTTLLPGMAFDGMLLDPRVLIESGAAAVLVGVLAAVAPILRLHRVDIGRALRDGDSYASTARMTLQRGLVSLQVALCTILLIGAGLFVKSLERITSQDLGFSTAHLLYATLDFRGYVPAVEHDLAYTESATRISQLQGFTATVAAGVPFGPHNIPPVSIPGFEFPPSSQIPIMYGATPAYLRMMHVSLLSGRLFGAREGQGTPPVVLVNSTLANTVWPGRSPLGKCMRIGFGPAGLAAQGNPADGAACREVVGVVSDSRARSLRPERNEDKLMQYYVPFDQLPDAPFGEQPKAMGLVVQVAGDLDRGAASVARVLETTTSRTVYAKVRPYQDLIDPQLRSWRLGATLFSAFGALALAISSVGLFGVVSYMVAQRTREIGVRLALGGSRRAVAGLVLTDTLRIILIGLVAGIPLALLSGPVLAASLFQTSPRDPVSIFGAVVVMVATGALAAVIPAWRSSRVDPLVSLRNQS